MWLNFAAPATIAEKFRGASTYLSGCGMFCLRQGIQFLRAARQQNRFGQSFQQAGLGTGCQIENPIANRQSNPVRAGPLEDSEGKVFQREIACRIIR
jgi:hypothetical protein